MNKDVFKFFCITFLVLVVISIPWFVNQIVLNNHLPFGIDLAGKSEIERSWLNFWASYFGCIFSSIVTFVVLYLTLRQNNIQNLQNREDAHKENQLLKEEQNKRFQYELSLKHVSELRSVAVLMYHSLVNSKVDTIYTRVLLDQIDEIDIKELQSLLMSVLDEVNKSYIEMQMLLSYAGDRDSEVDKIMDLVKAVSDEAYESVSDLLWLFFLCRMENQNEKTYRTEIFKYAAENAKRFKVPNQKHIWEIIIDKKLFNLMDNRHEIVMAWHDEWEKINDTYLVAIRGLVNHFYQKTKLTNV